MNDSTLKLIQYAQTPLPKKPRLAPWITAVPLSDDRLHLRGADLVVPLLHPLFIETFYTIKPLLDGTYSVDQITAAGGEKILPTTIEFFLKMLRANGILQEGQSDLEIASNNDDTENLRQFFSHYTQNPNGMVSALTQTRLAIIGDGQLKNSIKTAAAKNQIQSITDFSIDDLNNSGFETNLKNLDLVVACSKNPDYSFFEKINELCLKTGTRWMRVTIEGTSAFVGPTIIPFQTACFHCYSKRALSNSIDPEGLTAYQEHFQENEMPKSEGTLPTFIDLIGNTAILDLVRLITGFAAPATVGRLLELKPENYSSQGHDILRLPRCKVCRPQGSRQQVWSLQNTLQENESQ